MLREIFIHLEHAHLVLAAEYGPKLLIRQNLTLVRGILQVVGLDLLPDLAHHLGSRQRGRSDNGRQFVRRLQRLR